MKYSNELDKVSYSLGLSIASNLISSGVKTVNAEAFNDAMNTVFSGQMPEIMPDEANNILQDYFDKLQEKRRSRCTAKRPAIQNPDSRKRTKTQSQRYREMPLRRPAH